MRRKNPNRKLWEGYGVFDSEAQAICDALMADMLRLGAKHPGALFAVARAATFQLLELPRRTAGAQARLKWKPPRASPETEGEKP